MRLDDERESDNVEDRRGEGGRILSLILLGFHSFPFYLDWDKQPRMPPMALLQISVKANDNALREVATA